MESELSKYESVVPTAPVRAAPLGASKISEVVVTASHRAAWLQPAPGARCTPAPVLHNATRTGAQGAQSRGSCEFSYRNWICRHTIADRIAADRAQKLSEWPLAVRAGQSKQGPTDSVALARAEAKNSAPRDNVESARLKSCEACTVPPPDEPSESSSIWGSTNAPFSGAANNGPIPVWSRSDLI
jgi:hypothetical protein